MAKRRKVISPCKAYTDNTKTKVRDAFCEIIFEDGRLSICGVVGPLSNGNCQGGAGQCIDAIREGIPVQEWGWDEQMLQKLCDIWEVWHLNDMRAYCHHMKELGWTDLFGEKVKIKTWNQQSWCRDIVRDAEKRAKECVKTGGIFRATDLEQRLANLPWTMKTYNDDVNPDPEFYEFKEKDCIGHSNIEYKTRGWISVNESELGFLSKPCPVCGYKYGTKWLKEEVPEDVIEWLFSLPDAYRTPAWV